MPVILMNFKERKVYLKQKNIKSFNISNDFIDLSFVYSITNFFITCYMSVATQTVTRCQQGAFSICLLSCSCYFSFFLILFDYNHVGYNGLRRIYVVALRVSMVSLFPSSYDK